MEYSEKEKMKQWYQKTRVMWFAILAGMISLIILVIIFHLMNLFQEPVLDDSRAYSNLFLIIVFALAFLIIIMKRILFIPSQLVAAGRRKGYRQKAGDDAEGQKKALEYALERLRLYYLIFWILADIIVLAAFLSYLFLNSFNTFLIYSVVGLYTLFINYPNQALLERVFDQIMQGREE